MMITVTDDGFRAYRVLIRIIEFAVLSPYCVITFDKKSYVVSAFHKMRPNSRVLRQGESKGIGGGKAVALLGCPPVKTIIVIGVGLQFRLIVTVIPDFDPSADRVGQGGSHITRGDNTSGCSIYAAHRRRHYFDDARPSLHGYFSGCIHDGNRRVGTSPPNPPVGGIQWINGCRQQERTVSIHE
ncbi:hypothetical protein Barb6_03289 [Bacteroidales bacterium Barb6]|nr:hypothetical protein Barb6_03289 [Bacteroidales bacterium Barb6]